MPVKRPLSVREAAKLHPCGSRQMSHASRQEDNIPNAYCLPSAGVQHKFRLNDSHLEGFGASLGAYIEEHWEHNKNMLKAVEDGRQAL